MVTCIAQQSDRGSASAFAQAQSEIANPEKSLIGTSCGSERSFRYASLSSGQEWYASP